MEARTLFIVGMYVVGSPVVAWVAKKRRRSPLKWFVAAVLTSPAMAFCAIFYVNPYYPDAGETDCPLDPNGMFRRHPVGGNTDTPDA